MYDIFFVYRLSEFYKNVQSNTGRWKVYYDLVDPQEGEMPEPFETCDEMTKLIILKCIRPDKIVPAVRVSKIK